MSADRALAGTGTWLDDRLHRARGVRVLLRKIFPDHWSFLLGEIILYSFIILLLTGTFLTLWFQPSMTDVVYHGSYVPLKGVRMSEAYASTLHISFDVRGGLLIRQIHHWAADLFMAGIMAHMIRVFFTGAYRKPREINWLIGIILFTLGLLEGLFGYSLPDDLLSGAGLRILGVILALITVHLFLMFHQKHTQMPGKGRTNENVVGAPMYPYFMAKTGAFFFFVFAACALAATFAQINPIWLYGPFNPVAMSAGSQPDFYMGALEGALRVMPAWQWVFFGHTFAFNVFVPALLPLGLVFTLAALWPFLEQWVTGDKREHHVNDRPRNAPTRTALGIAVITFYGILWAEGANDIIADQLNVPLYWITWAARVGIFVGPVIAYIITKRICLGLQRKDNHLIEHGVETGIIRQLPGGEFIEETRPVDEDSLAVLLSRTDYPPLPEIETAETEVPSAGMRGGLGRVRERLYKVVTETAPLPEANGHAIGHGNGHGNGHAVEGNGHGHTAISTGASSTQPEPGDEDDR